MITRFFLLMFCAVSLAACACPYTGSYSGTPYEGERTAGKGASGDNPYCVNKILPW